MGADIQYKCVVSVILFCVIIIIIENTNYRGLAFVVTGQTDAHTHRQTNIIRGGELEYPHSVQAHQNICI